MLTSGAAAIVVAVASWFLLAAVGLATDEALLWAGFACGIAVLARAALRVRVGSTEQEIVVVNTWRTHRVRWSRVESIDLAGVFWPSASALLYVYTPLRLTTKDGGKIYIQASIADFEQVLSYLRETEPTQSGVTWRFRLD